ncbi:hypothetical protein BCON_0051g00260 [Botryotinia convoluta]|uniref:Uncharacterized protein n=1 Tax=Botryotinia convoluta TaxID=54673 RepID=A0A4Z1IBI8_9HELO|nr:hypothetical protein BCON_0051g00260 [Botryotinia convoluta]
MFRRRQILPQPARSQKRRYGVPVIEPGAGSKRAHDDTARMLVSEERGRGGEGSEVFRGRVDDEGPGRS